MAISIRCALRGRDLMNESGVESAVSVSVLAIADLGMEITRTQTAMHVRGKACFDAWGGPPVRPALSMIPKLENTERPFSRRRERDHPGRRS